MGGEWILQQRWIEQEEGGEEVLDDGSSNRGALGIFAVVMTQILLFLLIFGLSATVDIANLKKQMKNKFALGTGVAMQFIIMPVLGFVAVMVLKEAGLSQAMGLTLLVVTSSPGGSYSNWWCSTFNADLALSVAMTALSTILSVGLLPANLFLYTHLVYGLGDNEGEDDVLAAIDFGALFMSLGVVIAAIISGLFASYKVNSVTFNQWANKGGTIAGILLIVFSAVIGSGAGDADSGGLFSHNWTFYVGVAFPCLIGLALANLISRCFRLEKAEVVTISVECCYQNVGIATSVAISMFDDPTERAEAVAVPLFYGIVEAIVLGIYCVVAWKVGWTKAPADEKLCVVVSKTYEVTDDDVDENEDEGDEGENEARVEDTEALPTHHGWFLGLFSPFNRRRRTSESVQGVATKDTAEEVENGDRKRLVSEDYTARTSDTETSASSSASGGTHAHTSNNRGDVEVCLESIQEINVKPGAPCIDLDEEDNQT